MLGTLAGPVIATGTAVFGFAHARDVGLRLAFAAAVVWAIAGQYFLHRAMWHAANGLTSALQFYRWELQRRQSLLRRVLGWSFGPILLSVGTLIVVLAGITRLQRVPLRSMMPFCIIFAIWVVAYFVQLLRQRRQLRQEIGELDEMEKG